MNLPALFTIGLLARAAGAPASSVPASLDVDLSEAPRRVVHAKIVLPVEPGPLALFYPKWIPGEHMPSGPIADLAGLVIRAGGHPLPWERDLVDMYKISTRVPAGTTQLEIQLDYLAPPPGNGVYTSGSSITQNLAILNWNQVVLYPEHANVGELTVSTSVKLPPGWSFGTALPGAKRNGDVVRFDVVSLERLVDSPLLAGNHMTETQLGQNHGAAVVLHAAAETDEELQLSAKEKGWLEQLVREEATLFGARHFGSYHFLLALADSVPAEGIEHHESSDDRQGGRALIDKELATWLIHLLAHESTHSWNGKYRRPAGLATPDYQAPMKGDLLWVYEGLTQYLGTVLTARSGAWDAQTLRDYFALVAERQRHHTGRTWRPLQDTANAAQILYGARDDWSARRRSVDFYQEGDLIWLEVDARLREQSGGKVTLDDFCNRFLGGRDTGPAVVPYTFEDVAKLLNALSPGTEFGALWRARLDSTANDAPMEGLARAGWKLDYSETESDLQKADEKASKTLDLRSSIGIVLDPEKAIIADVIPGRPADQAGVMPGAKLIAVNGRKFTPERLVSVVAATKVSRKMDLLIENAESYRTFSLDYSGGLRYPHLSKIGAKPDLISAIAAPRAK